MSNETENIRSVKTGVQISSELLIPGGSNLVKGDFRQAGIHAGLSFFARMLFGLPGAVLVATNSIAKALTGQHLHEHLTGGARTQAQSSPTVTPREAAKVPPQTPASGGAPTAPGGVTSTSRKRSRPAAKKPGPRSATKRRKTSERAD